MVKKAKILVIDDEEDICLFTKSVLERTGNFEVTVSTDSSKGIGLAKTAAPDLVILDINMPKIDGSLIAEAIQGDKATCNIPIIFLTALINKEESIGRIGNYTYLAKPVSAKELIEKIESILER